MTITASKTASLLLSPLPLIVGAQPAGGTPTLTIGSAAGAGATASIVGTNVSGLITFTSGTALLTSGTVMTMTLADGAAFPHGMHVIMSAGNAAFASVLQYLSSSTTTTTSTLSVSLGLSLSRTYIGFYSIMGF